MATIIAKDIEDFCDKVRSDSTEITWASFKYEGKTIVPDQTGTDFEQLYDIFVDGERVYAYIRLTTGDDMSKRSKFALITFIGNGVSAVKRGHCSTDKNVLKKGITHYSNEFVFEGDAREEIVYEKILEEVKKAGGANYNAQS